MQEFKEIDSKTKAVKAEEFLKKEKLDNKGEEDEISEEISSKRPKYGKDMKSIFGESSSP